MLAYHFMPNRPAFYDWSERGITLEYNQQPPFETPDHTQSHHVISVQTGKSLAIEGMVDGKPFAHTSSQGDVSIIASGVVSRERWDDTAEYIALRLEPTLLSETLGEAVRSFELLSFPKLQDALLQRIVLALLEEGKQKNNLHQLYVESLVQTLSVHLVKHYAIHKPRSERDNPSPRLERVMDYIQDNLNQPISLHELARVAHQSVYHFSREFKRVTGKSPYQYILSQRLECAKKLLKKNLSIAEVAYTVGFADQSQLARAFKSAFGFSPTEFRKNLQT